MNTAAPQLDFSHDEFSFNHLESFLIIQQDLELTAESPLIDSPANWPIPNSNYFTDQYLNGPSEAYQRLGHYRPCLPYSQSASDNLSPLYQPSEDHNQPKLSGELIALHDCGSQACNGIYQPGYTQGSRIDSKGQKLSQRDLDKNINCTNEPEIVDQSPIFIDLKHLLANARETSPGQEGSSQGSTEDIPFRVCQPYQREQQSPLKKLKPVTAFKKVQEEDKISTKQTRKSSLVKQSAYEGMLGQISLRGDIIFKTIFRKVRKLYLQQFFKATNFKNKYKTENFGERYLELVDSFVRGVFPEKAITKFNKRASCSNGDNLDAVSYSDLSFFFGSLFLPQRMKRVTCWEEHTKVEDIRDFLYKFSAKKLEQIKYHPAMQLCLMSFISKLSQKKLQFNKIFKHHKEDFEKALDFLRRNYCFY